MTNHLLSSKHESNTADYRPWIILSLLAVILIIGLLTYLK